MVHPTILDGRLAEPDSMEVKPQNSSNVGHLREALHPHRRLGAGDPLSLRRDDEFALGLERAARGIRPGGGGKNGENRGLGGRGRSVGVIGSNVVIQRFNTLV